MKKRLLPSLSLAMAFLACAANGAPIPIASAPFTYTENFDGFGSTTVAWTNDSTLAGWYAQNNNVVPGTLQLQVSDGSVALSGLLNMGAAASTDRALGSKATSTGGFANMAYAVQFRNTTADPIRLTEVSYKGEFWRGNSVANTPEQLFLFASTPTAAPITNILSGGSSTNATAGAGFNALGAAPNWEMADAGVGALDGNTIFTGVTTPASIIVPPNFYVMLKWIDTNEANTDGHHGIDDVSVKFETVDCSVNAALQNVKRKPGVLPADPTDDVVDFELIVTGTGLVAADWKVILPAASATFGATANYSPTIPKAFTNVPIAEFVGNSLTLTLEDTATAGCNTTVTIPAPRVIGTNNLTMTDIYNDTAAIGDWTIDDATKTISQVGAGQGDDVVVSETINLSTVGLVNVTATLEAITGASSGFEAADSFTVQVVIDGGTPISILGTHDVDNDGRLEGAADNTLPTWVELPDVGDINVNATYPVSFIVPSTANSLQIRIIGNSNSGAETLRLTNLAISAPPPGLYASVGTSTFSNGGTPSAADDTISAPVTIEASGVAGTGWSSGLTLPEMPATGNYTDANPVNFTVLASSSPRTVTLTDNASATTGTFVLSAPARTFTASAASNIVRNENGPGLADDTVTFDVTIAGTNGGPGWATSTAGVTPASGAFGLVSFTVAAPLPASPLSVVLEDNSYATSTQTVAVALPGRYTIGQKDLGGGGGLTDVVSDLAAPPSASWANDASLLTLTMNSSPATVQTVTSETINLSAVGVVNFSAKLTATDTSTGSNFETPDKFKAELTYNVAGIPTTINLIDPYDVGDGLSAVPFVAAAAVPNGPKDGWMNGYQGTASAADGFATGLAEYDAHAARDEFNKLAEGGAVSLNNEFPLSAVIPADADDVKLVISGVSVGGTETVVVSDVLFSLSIGPVDTDGDGMDDAYETANGLNPNDPADKLTDLDGDGQSNFAEFLAGTGANNPSSTLSIQTIAPGVNAGEYVVTWSSVAGKSYQVRESTDLGQADVWANIGAVVPSGGATTSTTVTLPAASPRHFLQVQVVVP